MKSTRCNLHHFCFFYKQLLLYFIVLYLPAASADSLSVEEVITQALHYNPLMQASLYQEVTQQQEVIEANSPFYPHLSAQLKVDGGLQGSAAATGIQGIVASPFHRGPSVGLILEQNLWDFGRTLHSIEVAEGKVSLSKAQTKATKVSIVQNALNSFYSCSRNHALTLLYEVILKEAKTIQTEVNQFVSSGQRSVVEKFLAASQTAEIDTLTQDSHKRFEFELRRLKALTGIDTEVRGCPEMGDGVIKDFLASALFKQLNEIHEQNSPFFQVVKSQSEISLSANKLAFDDHLPRLVGIASYGTITNTWAGVPVDHWSAAAALIFPIFEGFRVTSRVASTNAKLLSDESRLAAKRFDLTDANIHLDKNIESADLRMKNLKNEVSLAESAMKTAKIRYLSFQGNLVDIRETLRNLLRTYHDLKLAEQDFLLNSADKSMIYGGLEQYPSPRLKN